MCELPHRPLHCSVGQSRPRLRRACGIARGARAFSPDRRDGPIRPNSHEFATEPGGRALQARRPRGEVENDAREESVRESVRERERERERKGRIRARSPSSRFRPTRRSAQRAERIGASVGDPRKRAIEVFIRFPRIRTGMPSGP